MKFGRYLEDTQIPEWKRAYIDYKGLKKRITAIKEERAAQRRTPRLGGGTTGGSVGGESVGDRFRASSVFTPTTPARSTWLRSRSDYATGTTKATQSPDKSPPQPSPPQAQVRASAGQTPRTLQLRTPVIQEEATSSARSKRVSDEGQTPKGINTRDTKSGMYGSFGVTPPLERVEDMNSPPEMVLPPPIKSISNLDINETLQPATLDAPRMTRRRGVTISSSPEQVLGNTEGASPMSPNTKSSNRDSPIALRRPRLFKSLSVNRLNTSPQHAARPPATSLAELLTEMSPLEQQFVGALDKELLKVETFYRDREREALVRSALIKDQLEELKDHRKIFHAYEDQQVITFPKALGKLAAQLSPPQFLKPAPKDVLGAGDHNPLAPSSSRQPGISRSGSPNPNHLDPDEYHNAKKKLKKAVLEFYRGIEYLHNYRILNLTGFRKALKKFEKATQIPISQLYHSEKIEPSILSHDTPVDRMLEEVENLYAARFEGGDRKKARLRLRASLQPRSHHYSTFRTGLFIGLSIPPLISGIYESFQPSTRAAVPAWPALLQIYLAFFVPVVFGLLVSLNIIVWAHVRINYIFIFELDVRTVVDSREYAELPAFLLLTLTYAFWLSFSGLPMVVHHTVWPLAWLLLTICILANPIPIFYPYSRSWILRKSGGLLLSGTRRVEFQDFFLGDQYCSMVYTLTSLYWMGCLYGSHWTLPWGQCELPSWGVPWLLATLPSWIRLVQCVRRYFDSWQYLHLVNGGKYSSSIIYYALYYHWRHQGSPRSRSFIPFVLFACITSIYSTSWDFLMDWSLFQSGARYRFLRKNLLYSQIWTYYFAMVTNVLIRFGWFIYLPVPGPHPNVRAGILSILEALRRFQWNFFRLENEQLGNTDQYRVTKDVPLPYSINPAELSDDGGDEDDPVSPRSSHRSPLRFGQNRTPKPFTSRPRANT
ncbi:related to putative phosphate transporter 1 [Serendipita indica DSM 11827]|uniref:Related to putative phosphate transporter 1 n=1 Tax=Serendipita indica (strain DSM 11827) TaxID=1109443 RepID=G4TSH3_SERID|nr:related to putative phosphate transporter 1 [Serendipita indica DSM 11827]